jgi:hypothetical protein
LKAYEVSEKTGFKVWVFTFDLYRYDQFKFDHVYDQDASQETVYERSAKVVLYTS